MSPLDFKRARSFAKGKVKVVDLFCGIGGLSHGLVLEGFEIVAGVDNDKTCKHAFEKNNGARFIERDIARFTPSELTRLFENAPVRILSDALRVSPIHQLTGAASPGHRRASAGTRCIGSWRSLKK